MYVLVPSVERKNNNDRYFEQIFRSFFLGIVRLALAYVFSKCYIGGHSTNIGFEKRIQIKLDQ